MSKLTHLDEQGAAHMVDISAKAEAVRVAIAEGRITMTDAALAAVREGAAKKGDVIAVARVAGIMAAKQTSSLIPLCHPLMISSVTIDFSFEEAAILATTTVQIAGPTGVEMEALTATSVALLTVYDMAKALDKGMVISGIRLLSKTGGKSGDWQAAP
jgi:cyclic pyranopterin monophosphate synthase